MGLKKIYINMGLLGLLTFGIMAFIITVQVDNSVAIPITNNSLINQAYGDLERNLSVSKDRMEKSSDVFENRTPTEYVGDLDVGSTISITRTAKSVIVGLWNVYIKLPMVILGVSSIVASLISSILLVVLIIGIWAIWKGAIS